MAAKDGTDIAVPVVDNKLVGKKRPAKKSVEKVVAEADGKKPTKSKKKNESATPAKATKEKKTPAKRTPAKKTPAKSGKTTTKKQPASAAKPDAIKEKPEENGAS